MGFLYGTEEEQANQPKRTPLLPAAGKEALASTATSVTAPVLEQTAEIVGADADHWVSKKAQAWRRVGSAIRDLIPEDRRKQLDASFAPKEGQENAWENPVGVLTMHAASSLPIIAGLAATRSPAVAAGLGGVQAQAQVLSDIQGKVDDATDEELAATYPEFADAVSLGLPPHEARKLLVKKNLASPETRVLSAIGGAAGAAPIGHIAGGINRATMRGRLAVGTGEAAIGNAIEGGLTDVGIQRGEVKARSRMGVDVEEALKASLAGGIEGVALGGAVGGAREALVGTRNAIGRGAQKIVQKRQTQEEPAPDQRVALGADDPVTSTPAIPTGLDAKIVNEQAKIDATEAAPPAAAGVTPVGDTTVPPIAPEGTAVLTEYGEATPGKVARKPRKQMRESDISARFPVPDVVVPESTMPTATAPDPNNPAAGWVAPDARAPIPPPNIRVQEGPFQPPTPVTTTPVAPTPVVDTPAPQVIPRETSGVVTGEVLPPEPPAAPKPKVTRLADLEVQVRPVHAVPDKIITVTDLPAVAEQKPTEVATATKQVAQQAVVNVPSKLPTQVQQARGLTPVLGTTTLRKMGTIVAKKIGEQLPKVVESRKDAKAAAEKARAEGKPVVHKPGATIDLKSVTDQAAAEHRAKEAANRVERRTKQMQETDRQAKSVVTEFSQTRTPDELQAVLKGDNDGIAQYVKHLQNIVDTAKKDRLPIFNESGNIVRNDDRQPMHHVAFIRDAAKILQRVQTAIRDPATLPKFREDVADLAMQQEALLKGDFEQAAAKRNAKKAEHRVSQRDVAEEVVARGAEADVADVKTPPSAQIGKANPQEGGIDPPPGDGRNSSGLGEKRSAEFWKAVDEAPAQTISEIFPNFKGGMLSAAVDFRIRGIMKRVMEKVGNLKVVIVPDHVLHAAEGEGVGGVWIPSHFDGFSKGHRGLVVMAEGSATYHGVLHEAIHSATMWELANNRYLAHRAEQLFQYVKREFKGSPDEYGLTKMVEFVAEAMSNPVFQAQLQAMPIPARLAQFNARTVWDGFVKLVARALGINRNQHNALDAAMRLFDEAADGQTALEAKYAPKSAQFVKDKAAPYFERRWGSGNEWKLRTQRGLDRLATLTQLGNTSDRLFGPGTPARKLVERLAKMATEKENILIKDEALLRRLHSASRRYGEKFREFSEFLHDESRAGVWADRELKDQKYVTKKDGTPTQDGWYGHGQHAALAKEWAKYVDNPEFVALRNDLHSHFAERQRDMSLQLIDNQLKALSEDGMGSPALAKRILEGNTTKADEAALGNALGLIKDAAALTRIPGPYVPFMRRGDYVVQARMEFDTPDGARRIDAEGKDDPTGNTLEFKTEAEAQRYVSNPDLDLHPKVKGVWVDKDTGLLKGTEADGTEVRIGKDDAQAERRYHVRLEDKHVEFFEREYDAQQRRAELTADPKMRNVNWVDIRRQNAADHNLNFMPEAIRRLATTIQKRDSFKQMPAEAQRELMRQIIDASIGAMGTTRAQSRRLPRTNVAGASTDLARNAQQYSVSTAGYLSKLKHQPEADKILKQMQEYTDAAAHERGPPGAEGDMQAMRRQRLQEFERRIYTGGEYEPTTLVGKSITRLLQLSYLDKLASPAYHIINSMEPWTVGLPTLAGRHGLFKATKAIQEAYNAIGALRTVGAGIKDTGRALVKDTGLTDYTTSFKDRVKGDRDGDGLVKMFTKMEDVGLMSRNAGFEMGRMLDPSRGRVGRTIDRTDHMARQMGLAIEAINRAVIGIAAYKMELAKNGGDHTKAMDYAIEQVHDTMGNYSGWNAAPIFNNPVGRVVLQFKKYAQKTYYLLGKQAIAAAKGDRQALKQFMGIMGTHMIVAGALGLPLEAIRGGLLAVNLFGISGFGYDDFEKKLRHGAASVFGKPGGEIFSRGLSRAMGIELSGRMGLSSLALSPMDPKSMKRDDLYAYFAQSFAGAPVSLLFDAVEGFQALGKGDIAEATRLLVPLKIYSDSIQAIQLATEGKKSVTGRRQVDPISPVEAMVKAAGFAPSTVTEQQEKTFAIRRDQKVLTEERQNLIGDWVKGQPAARNAKWQSILQWNKGKPREAQIKYQDLIASMQRIEKEQRTGTYSKGVRYTAKDRHLQAGHDFYNVR